MGGVLLPLGGVRAETWTVNAAKCIFTKLKLNVMIVLFYSIEALLVFEKVFTWLTPYNEAPDDFKHFSVTELLGNILE